MFVPSEEQRGPQSRLGVRLGDPAENPATLVRQEANSLLVTTKPDDISQPDTLTPPVAHWHRSDTTIGGRGHLEKGGNTNNDQRHIDRTRAVLPDIRSRAAEITHR
jgi:hypothetical protein